MYRKGVKDASEVFDAKTVEAFLETNTVSDLKFMLDEDGKALDYRFYAAITAMRCHQSRSKRAAILFDFGVSPKRLILGACMLVNSYYRNGLNDGIGMDLRIAEDYLSRLSIDRRHIDARELIISPRAFMASMQSEAMRLESLGFKGGFQVWKFITDALMERKLNSEFIHEEPEN
jgi:hypothetical protein